MRFLVWSQEGFMDICLYIISLRLDHQEKEMQVNFLRGPFLLSLDL